MITRAMERIQNLVPGIVPMMRNEDAYELIANKLEEQNLKLEKLKEIFLAIKNHTLHPNNKPSVWNDYLQDLVDGGLR